MKNVVSLAWFRDAASGYESPRAGTSQGIFFYNFIRIIVRAHFAVWKDWTLRIHHDERVKGYDCWPWLERLAECGMIELVPMGESKGLCKSMTWRLAPLFDPTVDYFICRDVDSLPMHRDRVMVEQFLASGAAVHMLLDSESHSGYMGGMTGYHAPSVREALRVKSLEELWALDPANDLMIHGSDQRLLNNVLTARLMDRTFVHQRRNDICYPRAMKTLPVAPQATTLDQVVRHVGAAFPRELADKVLRENHGYEDVAGHDRLTMLDTLKMPRAEPWYVEGAIRFLEGVIKPEWRVLEFGGGASSVWYKKRVGRVATVEHDPFWRLMIRENAKDVELFGAWDFNRSDSFDLVCIDGINRVETTKKAMQMVLPGGYLLLDNAEEGSMAAIHEMLLGWEKHSFGDDKWTTCLWRRA